LNYIIESRFLTILTEVSLELSLTKPATLFQDTIHYIQVVEILIEAKVRSVDEWIWKKQLRFYMGRDNVATVAMVDASFYYTYEYQGNAPKLVKLFRP